MNIKRILASNAQEGMRKVKAMLGPDAYILSNRAVLGGIELIAASGYDETAVDKMVSDKKEMPFRAVRDLPAVADKKPLVKNTVNEAKAKALFIKKNNEAKILQTKLRKNFSLVKKQQMLIDKQRKYIRSNVEEQRKIKNELAKSPAVDNVHKELNELKSIVISQFKNLGWNNWMTQNPGKAVIHQKLKSTGMDAAFCKNVAKYIDEGLDSKRAWRKALWVWSKKLLIKNDVIDHGGVIALVGNTGVGKTTTVAKLAAQYALLHSPKDVVIISCDHGGQGSHDRIISYGRALGVSVLTTSDTEDLKEIVEGLSKKKLILIDTAGAGVLHGRISSNYASIFNRIRNLSVHLVVSANTQVSSAKKVLDSYRNIHLSSCMITKLDEATTIGATLSMISRHKLAISYVTNGQSVPGNIEPAYAHRLISKAVSLSQKKSRVNSKVLLPDAASHRQANVLV